MLFTSSDLVKKLVEAYQKYPVLYNVECSDYKNKDKRRECITEIIKELAPYGTFLIEDAKKKINGLRTQFFNRLGKGEKK